VAEREIILEEPNSNPPDYVPAGQPLRRAKEIDFQCTCRE
jgi:hypothetical protein